MRRRKCFVTLVVIFSLVAGSAFADILTGSDIPSGGRITRWYNTPTGWQSEIAKWTLQEITGVCFSDLDVDAATDLSAVTSVGFVLNYTPKVGGGYNEHVVKNTGLKLLDVEFGQLSDMGVPEIVAGGGQVSGLGFGIIGYRYNGAGGYIERVIKNNGQTQTGVAIGDAMNNLTSGVSTVTTQGFVLNYTNGVERVVKTTGQWHSAVDLGTTRGSYINIAVVTEYTNGYVLNEVYNGAGGWNQDVVKVHVGQKNTDVAVGDLDNNGTDEIWVVTDLGWCFSYEWNGTTYAGGLKFRPFVNPAGGYYKLTAVNIDDVDGDGKMDVVMTTDQGGIWRAWLNSGQVESSPVWGTEYIVQNSGEAFLSMDTNTGIPEPATLTLLGLSSLMLLRRKRRTL